MTVRTAGRGACLTVGVLLAASALGAPPLTQIQDVLYRADGKLFNGVAVIAWRSFEAADASNITMQNLTVRIVNGAFRVGLVPNADAVPPAYYSVKYSSDGKIQFEETWQVPASTRPLRVRDVRIATPTHVEAGAGTLEIADIPGLEPELAARPVKGPGYAAGRAAVIGMSGALESATGNMTDCVRVDGSSGPCGTPEFSFVDGETPEGPVDGANTRFLLAAAPEPVSSLALFRNGILQKASQDFSIQDRTVEFAAAAAPQPGDTLLASYRLPGGSAAGGVAVVTPQVLCSGAGLTTTSTQPTVLASCFIAANTLRTGDRVEIQFNYQHPASASGFNFALEWGGTTIVQRTAPAAETLATGRAEAAVSAGGAQVTVQSWGGALPLAAGVAAASDSPAGAIMVNFKGNLAVAYDQLTLQHYSVIRYPGR
ncbi:MAG: hypothetical protein ACE15B_13285 [Bryobacteraceae bacterium]